MVGNHPPVAADVDLELVSSLSEGLRSGVAGLEAFQPVQEVVDHSQIVAEVAVPQVTLDTTQETIRGVRIICIIRNWVSLPHDVLAHDVNSALQSSYVVTGPSCPCVPLRPVQPATLPQADPRVFPGVPVSLFDSGP